MKPKERFINYALFSSSTNNTCEPNSQNTFSKEDIPIDLSIKKPVSVVVPAIATSNDGHFGLFHKDYERATFLSPPPPPHLAGDGWPGRYCFPSNLMAKHYGYHPTNLLPYLFINPSCLAGPDIDSKKPDSTILDHYVMPYRFHGPDGIILPIKMDHHHHPSQQHMNNGQNYHSARDAIHPQQLTNRNAGHDGQPLSIESSCSSSSSSPYDYHIPEFNDIKNNKNFQGKSHHHNSSNSKSIIDNTTNHHQTKLNGSQQVVAYDPKAKLKKALSYPCLPSILSSRRNQHAPGRLSPAEKASLLLGRSKSECNLHLIKSINNSPTNSNVCNGSGTTISSPSTTTPTKICAPKKLFASNYYQNILKQENRKELSTPESSTNKNNAEQQQVSSNHIQAAADSRQQSQGNNNELTQTKFYRNYRKEVIECWDNERRDNESFNKATSTSNIKHYPNSSSNSILDLRTNHSNSNSNCIAQPATHSTNVASDSNSHRNILPADNSRSSSSSSSSVTSNNHHAISNGSSRNINGKEQSPPPGLPPPMPSMPPPYNLSHNDKQAHNLAHPLDLYKQYYYYLMQEPAFASRAAVAVAETYAKLLSNTNGNGEHDKQTSSPIELSNSNHHNTSKSPPSVDSKTFDNNSLYETKRTSPDCSQDGSRTELRSADTTNGNIMFDRKRISRPLTGKHVRHGTGASPSTLISLRNMIQQRQKLKEIGKFDCNSRYGKGKANKRIRRK